MKLVDMKVVDFLNEVDSGSPVPGGGSVSSLASALGVSLGRMVGHLTFGKKKYNELSDEIKADLDKDFQELLDIKNNLVSLIDKDTEAYSLVMEAYKLPKETDSEKAARTEAIQNSLKVAIATPLEITELSKKGIFALRNLVKYGNQNAITDIGVGALLLYSGLEGGILNVKINLSSIKDTDYIENISSKLTTLKSEALKVKDDIMEIVNNSL